MNLLLNNEADEFVLLLINTVPMSKFTQFIQNIAQKKNWSEEWCCCYFEDNGDYRFETFEGDTYMLSYDKFADIVRLAIVRYYLGCEKNEIKDEIKKCIKDTVFSSALDNIDETSGSDIPLIG